MNAKAMLAKAWKNEEADLAPGRHCIDEEFVVRVNGTVEKCEDEMVAPTVSIPLIAVLALFWEKCGIVRQHALTMLREALQEAMTSKVKEDGHITGHIKDIEAAVKPNREHVAIIDAVKALGLSGVTADQVGAAIEILFPRGTEAVEQAEVIRGVFIHLQRQNRSDNVGR